MILTETHTIKRNKKTEDLFKQIDGYCFASKNLRNYTNYVIKQCSHISKKMQDGSVLEDWEKDFIRGINRGVLKYNRSGRKAKHTKTISRNNGFIADAYFLSWYLKDYDVYKQMPSATSAQVCIQTICRDWKAFYAGMKNWKSAPATMLGKPQPPRYYDKKSGRNWVVLTNQNIKVSESGYVSLPKTFGGLGIQARHTDINQVRIITTKTQIKMQVLFDKEEQARVKSTAVMGIDLNINNLTAIAFSNNATPLLIDGRPLKANNQWYNKEKARLQEIAKKVNNRYVTDRMCRLTERRNHKVEDYLHKVSRMVVDLAIKENIGTIVIGNNQGWKQNVEMGKKTNQSFVGIPYLTLIQKIEYKAALAGISVMVVNEAYTSGTSYLDGEVPTKDAYDKSRRETRGCFRSNGGELINADINGAYQIIKKVNTKIPIKHREKVVRLKVA